MSISEDYTEYQDFLSKLSSKIKPTDDYTVTVRLRSYSLCDQEINAEIIYWTLKCLRDNNCPTNLFIPILKNIVDVVRSSIKTSDSHKGDFETDTFETSKLQNIIMSSLSSFCERLLDNVELNKILPMTNAHISEENKFWNISHVSGSVKNRRKYMEDRHVCIDDFNAIYDVQNVKKASFYGVFDGHGGPFASCYTASQLPYKLANDASYLKDPANAMRNAFLNTDTDFLLKQKKSGTTVVCALYHPNESRLYVGWVGDSKALLVKDRQIMPIVKVHKPEVESERKRIKDLGGAVMLFAGSWRVGGQLNVSRSIGDSVCKPFVCADPDICCIELDKKEHFLVLGSDGLWDHVPEDEVASIIYQLIEHDCENLDRIPEYLIDSAIKGGSEDNITVIVVFFQHPSKIKSTSTNFEVIEPSVFNTNNMDDINNSAQVFDNHQFNDGLNNILQTNSNLTSTIPITTELTEKISNNFEIHDSERHFVNTLSEVPEWAGWGIDNELNKNQASGGGIIGSDLNDTDVDLGPETCVDVTDDVVMVTENSADTNLLDHSTLSNSKDTLPSSDNCNPFDMKIEDAGVYVDTNKSTPILSSEFDDDVMLAEDSSNLNQFTNQGFQPSPDEEMATSSPDDHRDDKFLHEDNEFVQTNGHLSPKSNADMYELENREKQTVVEDLFMEKDKQPLDHDAMNFNNFEQNDEPNVEDDALSSTCDLNQKSEIISDLDDLEPEPIVSPELIESTELMASSEPTLAVFESSKYDDDKYEYEQQLNKDKELLFEEEKDYFAEETSNVQSFVDTAQSSDEMFEKCTEKPLIEEERELIEKYSQENDSDSEKELAAYSQNEFEIKMEQIQQKEFVFEKENIELSNRELHDFENENELEIENRCQEDSNKNIELEVDEIMSDTQQANQFNGNCLNLEASGMFETEEPLSIETHEENQIINDSYSQIQTDVEATEKQSKETKEYDDFTNEKLSLNKSESTIEPDLVGTKLVESEFVPHEFVENELVKTMEEESREIDLPSDSLISKEPDMIEQMEKELKTKEQTYLTSENAIQTETEISETITGQPIESSIETELNVEKFKLVDANLEETEDEINEDVGNAIKEQDKSLFEKDEKFESKQLDNEIDTFKQFEVENNKISPTFENEINIMENNANYYENDKENIETVKNDENEQNLQQHLPSNIVDEQASVPSLQQTHESCDDSEDDEWNYMRLKEGQGEKQTVKSENFAVAEKDTVKQDTENVLEQFEESKENLKREEVKICDLAEGVVKKEGSLGEVILTNTSLQANNGTEQLNLEEDDDMSSQLNPEAKEFVPTFSPPGHNGFNLNDIVPNAQPRHVLDDVVAQSPRKGRESNMDDILLPSENEFDMECDQRPHELIDEEELYQEMNMKEAMHGSEKEECPQTDSPIGVQQFTPIDNLENADMKQSLYIEKSVGDNLENILNSVQLLPVEDVPSILLDENSSIEKHDVFWSEQKIGEPFGTLPIANDVNLSESSEIVKKGINLVEAESINNATPVVSKVKDVHKKPLPKKSPGTAAKTVETDKNLKNAPKAAAINKTNSKPPADAKKPIVKTAIPPLSLNARKPSGGVSIDPKAKTSSSVLKNTTSLTGCNTTRPRTNPASKLLPFDKKPAPISDRKPTTTIEKKSAPIQVKSRIDARATTTTSAPAKKPSVLTTTVKAPITKTAATLPKATPALKNSSTLAKRSTTNTAVVGSAATNGTVKLSAKTTSTTKVAPITKTSPRSTVTSSLRKIEAIKNPLKPTTTTTTATSRLGSKTTNATKTTTTTRITSTTLGTTASTTTKPTATLARKSITCTPLSAANKPATTLATRKSTPIKKTPLSLPTTPNNTKKSILGRSPSATSKAKAAAAAVASDAVASDPNAAATVPTTSDIINHSLPILDEHKNGDVEVKLNGNVSPIETATEAALDQSLAAAGPVSPLEMETGLTI